MATNQIGSVTHPTNKRLAFASYGTKLTLAEAVAFTAAVRNYQIALGREI
ncbi:MAG: hypothetical protein M1608_14555 [Candidatus Omnitrophica bacterium]|nr:hypothetical protein [Candidatus Omnitrophota bacterium]